MKTRIKRRTLAGLGASVIVTVALLALFSPLDDHDANGADAEIRLAQAGTLIIRGGTVHTVSGGVIEDGVVLIRDGLIAEVGPNIVIPSDAWVIDASGLIVTPGIIDGRSWFGLRRPSAGQLMATTRRMIDSFEPRPNSEWLRGGVTAVYISPSAQNLLGGFGSVVKLVGEREQSLVKERAGMSASFGEPVLRSFEGTPTTRQGMIARLRQEFIRTQEHLARWTLASPDVRADPMVEAIALVLRREVPLRIAAQTPDDIMTALRLAEEFDLELIIDSGSGAHEVAGALAAAGVPVVVGASILAAGDGGPFERFAHTPKNAARLHAAGVKIALSAEGSRGRSVVLEGVVAKAHGLPEDAALRALTLDAAEILRVADRLGSIEPGKDADLVIWDGHPLSTWGETRWVIVNGAVVFERDAVEAAAASSQTGQ